MISQTADYALRAVFYMAANNDRLLVTQHIAAGTQVPQGYLAKVLQRLHKAGLVTAQRGLGGGYSLSRPANEITIHEVVNAVDPVTRIHVCPIGLTESSASLCSLHEYLDGINAKVERDFKANTVAGILEKRKASTDQCGFPASEKKN